MKKSIVISIGTAAIIIALVLGYVAFVKQESGEPVQAPEINNNIADTIPTPENTTVPAPDDDNSEIDTADWLTYRNEEFGFEVKYPRDWEYKIQEGGLGADYGVNFVNSANKDNFIFFNLGPAIYFIENANQYAQEDFRIRDFKIEFEEEVFIGGINGVKYISNYDNPINKKYIAAYWSNKLTAREDDFYILETYIKSENKNSEEAIVNVFNQMLSTIKFDKP